MCHTLICEWFGIGTLGNARGRFHPNYPCGRGEERKGAPQNPPYLSIVIHASIYYFVIFSTTEVETLILEFANAELQSSLAD